MPKREEQACYDRKHCLVDNLAILSEVRLEKSVLKKFIGEESGNKCVQVIGHYTVIVLIKGGKNKVPKNTSLYAMLLTMILTASDISR